jgi:hypothetical protein
VAFRTRNLDRSASPNLESRARQLHREGPGFSILDLVAPTRRGGDAPGLVTSAAGDDANDRDDSLPKLSGIRCKSRGTTVTSSQCRRNAADAFYVDACQIGIHLSAFSVMAHYRICIPCPVCEALISVSTRKLKRFDFEVACARCQTIFLTRRALDDGTEVGLTRGEAEFDGSLSS